MTLSHFRGFLFYPYSNFSAASAQYLIPPVQSRVDFRAYPSVHSRDYFTPPIISSSVPLVGGAGLKYLTPDLLMLHKTDQENKVTIDSTQDDSQTGWKYRLKSGYHCLKVSCMWCAHSHHEGCQLVPTTIISIQACIMPKSLHTYLHLIASMTESVWCKKHLFHFNEHDFINNILSCLYWS